MKQIIYILLTTTMLGLMSCSDWLDVSPKTSIPTDKQFESESGFKDALTGIYLKLGTTTLYAGDLTYAYLDELAGLYSDYPGYNTNAVFDQSIVFDYENMFLSKKNGIYSTMYNIIANINNFLEYVDKNKDVLVTERYYETMKGEALGLRAFLHFDLLRMFGPVYKEHPASKAIPYRIAFDKDATPVLPASEVVDAILKDLNDAEKLLKESDPLDFFTDQTDEDFIDKNHFLVNREFRMNLYAVKAMLARVYCYKGDAESKELATEYAKQVIAASKYFTLYKSQTASNYNSIRYAEQIFGITVNEFSNLLIGNYMDMENTNTQQHFYLDGDKFRFFYETADAGNTDWRKNTEMFEVINGASRTDVFCRKYNQKPLNGGFTYSGADAVPLIRLPEMYYIIAETTTDDIEALNSINLVLENRGLDKLTSKDEVPATILSEYQKEFWGEGQLFFYYKRINASSIPSAMTGGDVEMNDVKYSMPLPESETNFR